jgi:hypothetical protein
MVYFSLILSCAVLYLVIRLMFIQKRFDFLNGLIITGALTVVLLDIDTIWTGRNYDVSTFISFGVLLLWFFNMSRKPIGIQN